MSREEADERLPNPGDNSIDLNAFEQILEMDDDEEARTFSKDIVRGFFQQAKQTFDEMDQRLEERNLPKLSELGHFLKGSSATLGLIKMRDSCERIQQLGLRRDEKGAHEATPEYCFGRIKDELPVLKEECRTCRRLLENFYADNFE